MGISKRHYGGIDYFVDRVSALNDDPSQPWYRYPCLEWAKAKTRAGYGVFVENGRVVYAHRKAMRIKEAGAPDKALACHHCDNPSCFRPSHIYAGTQRSNRLDMYARNRHSRTCGARGEAMHTAKLTEGQVRDLFSAGRAGQSKKEIAAQYGITAGTVNRIVAGKSWKHLSLAGDYNA